MPKIRADTIAQHKKIVRDTLLDAAIKTFVANGFNATSLSAIADVASIPRTTLYDYFSSKEELLVALVEERVPPRLALLVRRIRAESPIERLEAIYRESFALAADNLELTTVLFRVGRELPKLSRDRLWGSLTPVTDEIFRLASVGVDTGAFAHTDAVYLGQMIADLLVGGIDELTHAPDLRQIFDKVVTARLRFLRTGLSA